MSPEQVLSRPLDGRSDLYSAAIVLYEMLAGRTPFLDDEGEFSVRKAQVEAPPPPIRALPPAGPACRRRALRASPGEGPGRPLRERDRDGRRVPHRARACRTAPEWRAQADIAVAARTHR